MLLWLLPARTVTNGARDALQPARRPSMSSIALIIRGLLAGRLSCAPALCANWSEQRRVLFALLTELASLVDAGSAASEPQGHGRDARDAGTRGVAVEARVGAARRAASTSCWAEELCVQQRRVNTASARLWRACRACRSCGHRTWGCPGCSFNSTPSQSQSTSTMMQVRSQCRVSVPAGRARGRGQC
jgi:hypothetical protein